MGKKRKRGSKGKTTDDTSKKRASKRTISSKRKTSKRDRNSTLRINNAAATKPQTRTARDPEACETTHRKQKQQKRPHQEEVPIEPETPSRPLRTRHGQHN